MRRERLSRASGSTSPTFHALYEAMPPGTRAELINGVVYMPSPVGLAHGIALVPTIVWLDYYAEHTPGVQVMENTTTVLGWKSEPQPDGLLRVLPEYGGQTRDEGGFVLVPQSSSSRSPRRPGMSIWARSSPTMSRPGSSSTSSMRSTRTKSAGSARNKALSCNERSAGWVVPFHCLSGFVARPASTSEGRQAAPAQCSTWAARRPSTRLLSRAWRKPAVRLDRACLWPRPPADCDH